MSGDWDLRRLLHNVAAGIILTASIARAQQTPSLGQQDTARFERLMEQYRQNTRIEADHSVPLTDRATIDYGGFLSPSYLSLDDAAHDTHVLRQYDLIGYARINIDDAQEFFILGRAEYQDFAPGDSFNGKGDQHEGRLDRAFYRFDLNRYRQSIGKSSSSSDQNLTFEVGRQLIFWGNGLTLSRILDGGDITFSQGTIDLNLLAGITPEHTFDIDSSRPSFDENTRRGFYGAMINDRVGPHRVYGYVLFQQDYNDDVLTTGAVNTRFEYDSFYVGGGARGPVGDRIAYSIESTFEGGSGLSNSFEPGPAGLTQIDQRHEEIQAYAADAQLDYLAPDEHKTRLSFETILASGDPDRSQTSNTFGGNRPGTADHAFNAFGLLNTGFAFAPPASNLLLFRIGGSTFPLPHSHWTDHLQVGTDFLVFLKYRKNAPIDESTQTGDHYLGVEPDIFINWQITEDVTLAARYGVFFPGDSITTSNDARQAFFMEVTYAF
jgi:hypothetical protein